MMAAYDSPSMRDTVPALSRKNSFRPVRPAVAPKKCGSVCIEARYVFVHGIYRIVITSLTVFCLVVYIIA